MRRGRHRSLFARAFGIFLMIPSLLQLPLPRLDFHVIRHQHGAGEVCAKHDHLLRWHPQAADGRDVAVLHWHWLLPRVADPTAVDPAGKPLPLVHAHDGDHEGLDPSYGTTLVREPTRPDGRGLLAEPLDHDRVPAIRLVPPAPPPLEHGPALAGFPDRARSADSLSLLVRWNC